MPNLRPVVILTVVVLFTLPLMAVQGVLLWLAPKQAKRLPVWYHRQLCRILGVRVHVDGAIDTTKPVLLLANHISWLDIPVISQLGPVSFVAKREVSRWPLIGWLAKLQRTIFVDRERRISVGGTANEITARLRNHDHIVLFPEGTSGDGNHVLPFKSALLAAAKPSKKHGGNHHGDEAYVQTLAIAYTGLGGLPLGRRRRHIVAWYGDMDMVSHMWQLLSYGPLDVHVKINPPVPLDQFDDRKALCRYAHRLVKNDMARLLSRRPLQAA